MPVTCSQNDGNDDGFASMVARHRTEHLPIVTVIGCEEIGTHEKQDNVGVYKISADARVYVLPGTDPSVVPSLDYALALEHR